MQNRATSATPEENHELQALIKAKSVWIEDPVIIITPDKQNWQFTLTPCSPEVKTTRNLLTELTYPKKVLNAFISLDNAKIPLTYWVTTVIAQVKDDAQKMADVFLSIAEDVKFPLTFEKLASIIEQTSFYRYDYDYYSHLSNILNSLITLQKANSPMMDVILSFYIQNWRIPYNDSTHLVWALKLLNTRNILTKETIESVLTYYYGQKIIIELLIELEDKRLSLVKLASIATHLICGYGYGFDKEIIIHALLEHDEAENKQTLRDIQYLEGKYFLALAPVLTELIFSFFYPDPAIPKKFHRDKKNREPELKLKAEKTVNYHPTFFAKQCESDEEVKRAPANGSNVARVFRLYGG